MIEIIIETVFSLGLFINAILFIPQIFRLLKTKNSKSFSLTTFSGFCFIQIFTMLHGYLNKDNLLFYGTGLSLITCGIVTYLIVFFRLKFNR